MELKSFQLSPKPELEKAMNPNERTKASYLKENIIPLQQTGNLEVISGDKEIAPGVSVKVTGGHTRGHQIVFIQSANKKSVYWSDLIPTTSHIDIPYIMSYDIYPDETLNEKKKLIATAIKEQWLCFWEHDPSINCGHIQKTEQDKFKIIPLNCNS
jgi:glyoxylase-like metal-dependent hydrolase (beta-lactamase superfamily II)